jgi:hypothetical protein
MLTLIIALLMLFIGYHVGAAHPVERISKRVHEGTFAAMMYNKKTARWEKLAIRMVSQNELLFRRFRMLTASRL